MRVQYPPFTASGRVAPLQYGHVRTARESDARVRHPGPHQSLRFDPCPVDVELRHRARFERENAIEVPVDPLPKATPGLVGGHLHARAGKP